MAKLIVGRFPTYEQARATARELIDQHIDKDRMSIISPDTVRPDEQARPAEVEGTGTALGTGAMVLAGAATLPLAGAGLALVYGSLAALASTHAEGLDEAERQELEFERMIIDAGLATSAAEARVYADDVQAGSSLLAVEVADEQQEAAAETLRRFGGTGLVFTNLNR